MQEEKDWEDDKYRLDILALSATKTRNKGEREMEDKNEWRLSIRCCGSTTA